MRSVRYKAAAVIVDRVQSRRALLAGASFVLGACYGLLPLVPAAIATVAATIFVLFMPETSPQRAK